MRRIALLASVLALAACDRAAPASNAASSPDDEVSAIGNAAAAKSGALSIDVPGFKAQVNIPSISVSGGGDDAIDGVPLYPGTRINGASVVAAETGDKGQASLRYAAAAAPATVLAYYRDHALHAGYRLGAGAADSISAEKSDGSSFTIVAHPSSDGGTEGTLTASGR